MNTRLQHDTVVVTGGSSGLGFAIARRFLESGTNVMINGRAASRLADAAQRLGHADSLATVVGDVTDPATDQAIIAAAVERFGSVGILVNNAGAFRVKPFTDYGVDELDGYLGYLRGTFVLSQAAVRQMRKQGHGGSIVNIGTILTWNGVLQTPSSAPIASKGGITALARSLAVELAADGIRVNVVAPGTVPTPLYGKLDAATLQALNAMQPLGRYGTPEDVADAVFYLATATWVTGAILPVDGGVAAGGAALSQRHPARETVA